MYISITGLKPKGFRGYIRFWMHAIPSYNQARNAEGNRYCSVKKIQGYQCTLTAWDSREAMLDFMRSGAHLEAMKVFPGIATGKIFGYEFDTIPDWKEAFEVLMEKGRSY
jgi:hypothetical protein